MSEINHTFAICACKENPHLEEVVKSVANQTVKSKDVLYVSCSYIFQTSMSGF